MRVVGLEVFVVADNLLDREYQEVLGYPALGRAVRAGGLRSAATAVTRPDPCFSPGARRGKVRFEA